jgi:hypothetical protein
MIPMMPFIQPWTLPSQTLMLAFLSIFLECTPDPLIARVMNGGIFRHALLRLIPLAITKMT